MNPRTASVLPPPSLTLINETEISLSYIRADVNDLSFEIESSSNLVDWTIVQGIDETVIPIEGGLENSTTVLPLVDKQFYRVQVSRADLGIGGAVAR